MSKIYTSVNIEQQDMIRLNDFVKGEVLKNRNVRRITASERYTLTVCRYVHGEKKPKMSKLVISPGDVIGLYPADKSARLSDPSRIVFNYKDRGAELDLQNGAVRMIKHTLEPLKGPILKG